MLQMGFQCFAAKRIMRSGYERLTCQSSEKMTRLGKRCNWVKSVNGRFRGLRLSRSKKLSLRCFSNVVLPRIVRIYSDVVNRMNLEYLYAGVVLPTQWGLPVISHHHPSVVCRRSVSVTPIQRKFTCTYL